jgi:hypothetical protein
MTVFSLIRLINAPDRSQHYSATLGTAAKMWFEDLFAWGKTLEGSVLEADIFRR